MALEIPPMFSLTNKNILLVRFSKMGSEVQVASQSRQAVSFLATELYTSSCKYEREVGGGPLKSLLPGKNSTAVLPGILSTVSVPSFPASV